MKNELLDYASAMYYNGTPVMSDEDFDKLSDYYSYESVGAPVLVGDRVSHAFPMWSLQKFYKGEDSYPSYSQATVSTKKLDGAAISIIYTYGNLTLGITRGDGKAGINITDKVKLLVNNYLEVFKHEPVIQITGEVVAPKHIENSRNYAAGALNLKDMSEFKQRDLTFIAYGLFPYQNTMWSSDMTLLSDNKFNTVLSQEWNEFPDDGIVVRLDDYEVFNSLGYTSKHPKGAYAIKERKGGIVTRLLDVEWQVGRSGVVSPVAILEPVNIDGAMVSRATLHNIKYIRDLDLDYNCLVEVIRSGEIIPKVIKRIYE